ncbi:MAG: bifunctional (p)ppGpp synthetase/guanosine-3',5'-bis(diphosphate) 3'-pyrophosphohydrolase [Thermoleophilia bacterium]|nr:bifunctional (p)ppGpp synthetase/guanosine-3',5'-bis(diphosphate) 3'-pyrophosphohydrolase [Thermoleophilia bacterium]
MSKISEQVVANQVDLEPGDAELRQLLDTITSYNPDFDRDMISRAYHYSRSNHAGSFRKSGEDFISHPLGTARICADLKLDSVTIAAALLHDVVEDTPATLETIRKMFGDEVADLVDGVTKLQKVSLQGEEEEQAENLRKMIIAMARDIRVILIKLADRTHNMRTICHLEKQRQIRKAKETLEIYAPLAHRLGIYSIKWELEDLAFSALHPRKYSELQQMVAQRRTDRETYVAQVAEYLGNELKNVGIASEIEGRAKHFYSIYNKMVRRGKEFNEIYDLTAMRVLVDSVKDCYGSLGIIHALWKPMPGRFKDYIAMPKFNMYRSLHTTVIGPQGKPLEIQIRTHTMHQTAEYGIAAHWLYKEEGPRKKSKEQSEDKLSWLRQMMEWQSETDDPKEFMKTLRIDLFEEEVFVFTPKGEVISLAAGGTPVDFAYAVHTDVGHHCVGAKVNGRIVPLQHPLQSGDFIEILTSKSSQGPSRDWLKFVKTSKARNKIRQWFKKERRQDSEHIGREMLQEALRRKGLASQKIVASPAFSELTRAMGFLKAEDLYVSLGTGKTSPQQVLTKITQQMEAAGEISSLVTEPAAMPVRERAATMPPRKLGISVDGVDDVGVRLAKCCKPLPGDKIAGYISLGKGVSIHRKDCANVRALERQSKERFIHVSWKGASEKAFRAEFQVEAMDRSRLLEDISRTLSDSGINIVSAQCLTTADHMVKDRFVVEIGDAKLLDTVLDGIKTIDTVFDAYRVTPGMETND